MSTPAGWYDDGSGRQRWWDGTAWSNQYREPAVVSPEPYSAQTSNYSTAPYVPTSWSEQPLSPQPGPVAVSPHALPAPKGLAVTALIVGIVAFLTGLVPVVGVLLGVASIVMAIIALSQRQPRALAITAIVLGACASVASIATTAGVASLAGRTPTSVQQSVADDEETSAPKETEESAPEETEPAAEEKPSEPEPPAADGSASNPLPQPYVAKGLLGGEKYSLTARVVNASANAQVEEWNMFNEQPPAGYKYVVVEMTMTGIDPDGVEPSLATFDLSLATAEGNRYDAEFVVFGDGMPAMNDGPTLYPGNAFTGYSAYIVPEAAVSFLLYDNGNYIVLP